MLTTKGEDTTKQECAVLALNKTCHVGNNIQKNKSYCDSNKTKQLMEQVAQGGHQWLLRLMCDKKKMLKTKQKNKPSEGAT